MSVNYTIKEKLVIRNANTCQDLIYVMSRQLSLLGFLMLQEEAAIESLPLNADGEQYHFAGTEITPDLHKILRAMENAEALELEAHYDYTWRLCYEDMEIGPFTVCESAEMLLKEDAAIANDFYYSMYNDADCNPEEEGKTVEYGTK